jgi:MFS family permease
MASTSVLSVGFNSIAHIIATLYKVNPVIVESQNLIFFVVFIPANFVVIHLLNIKGLRVTLVVAAFFVLIGGWLRLLVVITDVFETAFIGSIFAAVAQAFFYNTASKVASNWFGDKERALSTALGSLSSPLGSIIGFVLPATMIGESDLDNPEEGRTKFKNYVCL